MERISHDYLGPLVNASWSALLELAYCLGSYQQAMVLVGGWVPYILLREHGSPGASEQHVGSIDIDIVIDPDVVGQNEYATIETIIMGRGWERMRRRPFSYARDVKSQANGDINRIKVDFLTTRPEDLVGPERIQEVQEDLQAFTFASASIAIEHNEQVKIEGRLPRGGELRTVLRMADVVGCIGMKGFALEGRYKEKDAYDIYTVLEGYDGGPKEVAELVKPYARDPLIDESLGYIADKFSGPDDAGPVFVADFFASESGEARDRRVQRAYQVVRTFIDGVHQ